MANKVWLYGRRSKLESKKESETAMDKQYIKVLAHAVDNYRGYDIAMYSDESNFFWDENISGSTLFSERPSGSLVYHGASRGDVVIAVAMDRLFRNKADGFKTIEEAKEYFNLLESVGIFHKTPKSASEFVNSIFDDIPQTERFDQSMNQSLYFFY